MEKKFSTTPLFSQFVESPIRQFQNWCTGVTTVFYLSHFFSCLATNKEKDAQKLKISFWVQEFVIRSPFPTHHPQNIKKKKQIEKEKKIIIFNKLQLQILPVNLLVE